MRHLLPLSLSIALLASACSGTATTDAVADVAAQAAAAGIERVVTDEVINAGTPVTMADLSIDGMSCEMMCGGSIKKALAKLPGVSATEIAFVEGEERDHAIVTYDASKISDAQLIEAVQQLHDGQYKVLAVEVTKQVLAPAATVQDDERSVKEENSVSATYSPAQVLLPSILSILTRILRG
jgi:copper chaperone CopZ